MSFENAALRRRVETQEKLNVVLIKEKEEREEEKRASQKAMLNPSIRAPFPAESAALVSLRKVIQRDMGLGFRASSVAVDELVRCLFILGSDKALRWDYSLPLFYDQVWHHAILNTAEYPLFCHFASTCYSGCPATEGLLTF